MTRQPAVAREYALVDLLDRLLANGLVLTGELTLAIADVDLVHISLRALITSITEGGRHDDGIEAAVGYRS